MSCDCLARLERALSRQVGRMHGLMPTAGDILEAIRYAQRENVMASGITPESDSIMGVYGSEVRRLRAWERFGKEAIRLARGNITGCGTCSSVRIAYGETDLSET